MIARYHYQCELGLSLLVDGRDNCKDNFVSCVGSVGPITFSLDIIGYTLKEEQPLRRHSNWSVVS